MVYAYIILATNDVTYVGVAGVIPVDPRPDGPFFARSKTHNFFTNYITQTSSIITI